MNYRHVFHAGNFADLLKHAVLLEVLSQAKAQSRGPLTVIDTHAGAGVYDLEGDASRRTGEAVAIFKLMNDATAPAVFEPLKAEVRRLNKKDLRFYPGSPLLIAHALRPRDQLMACETNRDDFELLRETLRSPAGAFAMREDGWELVRLRTPRAPAPVLVLIDPPYEAANDPDRAADAVSQILGRNVGAVVAVWMPIKDLATFDSMLLKLEEAARGLPILVAEGRLRSLDDPLRLNGCAMIVVNPTKDLEEKAGQAAEWIVGALGDGAGLGHVAQFNATAFHRRKSGGKAAF